MLTYFGNRGSMFSSAFIGYHCLAHKFIEKEEVDAKMVTQATRHLFAFFCALDLDAVTTLVLIAIGASQLRTSPSAGWAILGTGLGYAGLSVAVILSWYITAICQKRKQTQSS